MRHEPRTHPTRKGRVPRRDDDVAVLFRAALNDDHCAWRLLRDRYEGTIRSIARRYRLNEADQEDVAQRTWLRLVEHIDTVREPKALSGWLKTTARRECLRIIETASREVLADSPDARERDDSVNLEEGVLAAERCDALEDAIGRLPARQRQLMHLVVHRPELSFRDLATEMKAPIGALGPTRARAIQRLRRDPHLMRTVRGNAHLPRRRRGHDVS